MKKTTMYSFLSAFLFVTILCSLISSPVLAAPKVIWQQAVDAVYDATRPGVVLMYKDELSQGGMDLYTGEMTDSKADADIAYYNTKIGAKGILDMGAVDFNSIEYFYDSGYVYELTAAPGHVYIVLTHKGEFAKVMIKAVTASTVSIKYAIFKEYQKNNPPQTTAPGADSKNPGTGGTSQGADATAPKTGSGSDSSGSMKLDRFDDMGSFATIEEGKQVTIKWDAVTGGSDESYDIYRSDNGAAFTKLSDLRLVDTEFTDSDCTAGHYYLYRVIAYDGNDNMVKAYPLFKAIIITRQTYDISMQIGSSKVKVDGTAKDMKESPALLKNKILIPASYLDTLLGVKVTWSVKTSTAAVSYDGTSVALKLNSAAATAGSKKITLDTAMQMVNGKLMIPASLLSSTFGFKLKYAVSTRTLTITGVQKQKTSTPQAASTKPASSSGSQSDFAFKTFILWVPGGSYSYSDYISMTNTIVTSAGTLPKSTISVDKNGTYTWNSAWDQKIIKGKWTANSDGSLNIINGQEGKTWKLEKSTAGKNEDIFLADGFSWYSGKAVNVKNK